MIEGHGDDYGANGGVRLNFSSNVYGHADLSGLYRHLADHLSAVSHYPAPEAHDLRQLLAAREAVDADSLVITAGATQAMYLVAQAFAGSRSCILGQPTFREYEDACRMFDHQLTDHIEEADLVWVCNPNNPTGRSLSPAELRILFHRLPAHSLLIIDQSYAHFTATPPLPTAEAVRLGRVVCLRSFTKRYGMPGLRIGWAAAAPALALRMRHLLPPWSVGTMEQEAARYFLSATSGDPLPPPQELLAEAQRLRNRLNTLPGLSVSPTSTHFMLCELESTGSAASLKTYLLERFGILIRDASNFRGLTPRHFRVSAQRPDENDQLVEAIASYLHDH